MFTKLVILAVIVVGANCRYLTVDVMPQKYIVDSALIQENDLEDLYSEQEYESVRPVHIRHRRQAGMMNTNPDGSANVMAKFPLAGNDKNILSAIGGINGAKDGGFKAGSAGLALDNVNGHGLSLTGTHLPNVGNQLTGAGKVNMFHNDNHDLTANAFATRTFPSNPAIPNFNTVGGSMDYMYKNKVGGSLGMSHTDLFKQTDYSAMGKLNLYRNPTSSLDFSAGASKSVSPFIPRSSWQPSAGFSFTKYF
ncbi:attacin-like [Aricia agestis]|uniref:attacin-like n=1 Tax=Aricia agestis TaxID=91739 RepID=UPI001C201853|nr:attacin-like [Aricia agestis]